LAKAGINANQNQLILNKLKIGFDKSDLWVPKDLEVYELINVALCCAALKINDKPFV
jgi:hypothetical protein